MAKPKNAITFTMQRLSKITPPEKGRVYYRDTATSGLVFVITANNSRTFYFSKRINRKPVRIKIGNYPAISIDTARQAAHRFLGEIAQGQNPYINIKKRVKSVTLKELFLHWLEVHAKKRKKTWKQNTRTFNQHVKPLHDKTLNNITKNDIIALHQHIGRHSGTYQANRTIEIIRSIYSVADQLGYTGENPCIHVERYPEYPRERFIRPHEFAQFYAALCKQEPLYRDLFFTILLTGQRKNNVCRMQWRDIDFENKLWYVSGITLKNGSPLAVVLSDPVIEVLQARRDDRHKHPEWVFPSKRGKDRPVGNPTDAWDKLRKESGLTDLRIHDLRRTFGSWQAINGTSLHIIGKALGHKSIHSTKIYAHLITEPIRDAVTNATQKMLEYCRIPNRPNTGQEDNTEIE
ncbi:MAG: tyrosine-type recombinase/integrase [Planctomycetaceae bacterium]|nr:tyrosine-type recombinase/integrase [Planctomycetaceae bacterium]